MTVTDERAVATDAPAQGRRVPGAGWRIIAAKELGDHMSSVRFGVLLVLLAAAAACTVYAAGASGRWPRRRRESAPSSCACLRSRRNGLPPFFTLIGFLAPLLGIAFGFDAVNGERSQGTLPRLLSQPIHRDDVINGKFAAGIAVIGLLLGGLALIVAGVGMLRLGIRLPRCSASSDGLSL